MGVLLYILVTGSAPFNSDDQRKVSHCITVKIASKFSNFNLKNGVYKMPDTLSPDCQDLIRGMLTVNVERRMKMEQIMSHRWVMDGYNMLKATTIYQVIYLAIFFID
jgi:serine/threonine protein kinase